MGKKTWLSAVKKVVGSSYLRKKKEKKSHKSKSKSKSNPKISYHGDEMSLFTCLSETSAPLANAPAQHPAIEETKVDQPENEQMDSVAYATTMEEDAAERASMAPAEVDYLGESMEAMEEEEAIKRASMAPAEVDYIGESMESMEKEEATIRASMAPAEVDYLMEESASTVTATATATATATTMEEEAAERASIAPAEVDCVTSSPQFVGESMEEVAAIKIQTAFRGHLARKIVKQLRAHRRLRLWIQGQAAKRQTASTLMALQTMGRVQSQVRTRKTQVAEVNETLQRQQHQRREKQERAGFDLSPRSKEQVDAALQRKKVAAERREKVIAYSLAHQQTWRKSLKSANSLDANWGWSWSERWNADRPWGAETTNNKESVEARETTSKVLSATSKNNASNKGSPKLVKSKSQIVEKRTAALNTGLAKKRTVSFGSPSSRAKRTTGTLKKNSKTVQRTRSV